MAHSLILPLDATMKGGKTITKAFLTVHTYLHIRLDMHLLRNVFKCCDDGVS